MLTFVYRNFDGCVPTFKDMGASSIQERMAAPPTQLEINSASNLNVMDSELSRCHFKAAIYLAMSTAHQANRYLDEKSPWKVIKGNRQAAANSLYVALCVISHLRTMLYPFLPFSSQKLHRMLGFEGNIEDYGWKPTVPQPGQKLLPPEPLFSKLDDGLIEEETARLGQPHD